MIVFILAVVAVVGFFAIMAKVLIDETPKKKR